MRRRLFKFVVGIHTTIYRLTGGRVGVSIGGMRMLILTTIGRRSGKAHKVPLGYIMDGDSYVVIASYGGSPRNPDWYLNIECQRRVFVQVNGYRISGTAKIADTDARERLWTQLVAKAPLYQKYQDRTTSQIPMILLTPCAD